MKLRIPRVPCFGERNNDPRLRDLVAKYGLEDRVDWEVTNRRGLGLEITFVRIIHLEEERKWPLPPGFIAEAQKRLRKIYLKLHGEVIFPKPRAMTLAEIESEIKAWASYCAFFNVAL